MAAIPIAQAGKLLFKQGVEEVIDQGGRQLTKQVTDTAISKTARNVPTKVPTIEPEIIINSGAELDTSLSNNEFWRTRPKEYKKVIQSVVDQDPTGKAGKNVYKLIDGVNLDDEEAGVALDALYTNKHAQDVSQAAVPAKRAIQAASEGKVVESSKTLLPTISDDLNYLKPDVDYTDELAQWEKNRARAERDMAKADAKNANYSEDLLNRITTIAGLPGQVKKWLKKAGQKAKAGIPFEEGDALYDEMGEFIGSSIEGMNFQELHHELMKAVYSAYVDTAFKLVKAGKGNKMDIINLNRMAQKYGFGMGDFGVEPYPRLSHSWAHSELIKEGTQKSGDALKAQVQAITEQPNMQALAQDFKRSLEELAIPMRRKMDLGNRAYKQLPELDRLKVHQLKTAKDALKDNLKEVMIGEFQQAGLPIPSSGGGVDFFNAFKKAGGKPSQEALELDKAIKLTRKESKALNEKMKSAIGPIVEKDIELDVEEMEQLIDMHFEGITDADTMTREWALKMGSIREAQIKAEQKAAAETYIEPVFENRSKEEWARDLEKLKRGEISIPTTLPK